jgi:hypothetical protein
MVPVQIFIWLPAFRKTLFHRCLVKFFCVPLDNGNGIPQAGAETVTKSVTQVVGREDRLTIYNFYGAFRTGWNTFTAAIMLLRIYGNDISMTPFR